MILQSIYNKAQVIFNIFKPTNIDDRTKKFIKHNWKIWKEYIRRDSTSEVLTELTKMQTNIISYSYMLNILAKKHNAKIKAYRFGKNSKCTTLQKKLYNSFNAEVFSYSLNKSQLLELNDMVFDVYSRLKTKNDALNLTISNIWLGDLLYDYHLRVYMIPTMDMADNRVKNSLIDCLYQYIYWRDYFDTHNVKAVNVTHCGGLVAIPLRVAVSREIPAYQCNTYGCYYLTPDKLWAYNCGDLPMLFKDIPENERVEGLKVAKVRIERRFSGEVGVDMRYSSKSAYTNHRKSRIVSKSKKMKIFIATHCFFDGPHTLGLTLFIDVYEWLTFLGNISEKTDYEWYIKTHPDYLPENTPIINEFIEKYPKFKLIPADTSHHQIIEEGIDYVVTVQGSIGFEYAALGKTVINCSLSNPHIAYNFNIHPKSVEEYEKILMNLADHKLDIDINEVYEYYYMRFINNNNENWLFDDYDGLINEIGGYAKQFSPVAYQKFLEEFSAEKHKHKINSLNTFIESKDYCMQKKHMEFE